MYRQGQRFGTVLGGSGLDIGLSLLVTDRHYLPLSSGPTKTLPRLRVPLPSTYCPPPPVYNPLSTLCPRATLPCQDTWIPSVAISES